MKLVISVVFSLGVCLCQAQQAHQYDLVQLLQQNKLITKPSQQTKVLEDPQHPHAITTMGRVWLKDIKFKEGTIDVDLRGKDVFLQSFLGIAFHGVDSSTYDAIYFRPFNFKHADTLRRKWSVQYFSLPGHDYDVLRRDHPLMYENAVTPVPEPADWFHATIVIKDQWVTVYVNHSSTASLHVKLLNERKDGILGLWTSGLSGDFANLTLQGLK